MTHLGDGEVLRRIEYKVRNLPGGGKARLQFWGLESKNQAAGAINAEGFTLLGERFVQGRADSDVIDVSQKLGQFGQIRIVVLDSDLELTDMIVTTVDGKKLTPNVRHSFREGSRTRSIDLPGRAPLRRVELKYKNLPGGGKARVQVWGK